MLRRQPSYLAILVFALCPLLDSRPVVAQETFWSNATGGDFFEAGNWTAGVPGSTNSAVFDIGSIYDVDLSADATIGGLRNSSGETTILGGNTLNTGGWILDGGTLTFSGTGTQANLAGGDIRVDSAINANLIVGNNSSLTTNSSTIYVGEIGSGLMSIETGGSLSTQTTTIGFASGSTGFVGVSGAGSTLDSTGLGIGISGSGILSVTDGGTVTGYSAIVGRYGGSHNGRITVSGADSVLDLSSNLILGFNGEGNMTVSDGGKVFSQTGQLAHAHGSESVVTIDGKDSEWNITDPLSVGSDGNALLQIFNGGLVTSNSGTVGVAEDTVGSIQVHGLGSRWINHGNLNMDSIGTGTLAINNNGLVVVKGRTSVGQNHSITVNNGRLEFGRSSLATFQSIGGVGGSLDGDVELFGDHDINALGTYSKSGFDVSGVRHGNSDTISGTGHSVHGLGNFSSGQLLTLAGETASFGGVGNHNEGLINNSGGSILFDNDLTNRSFGVIQGGGQFSTGTGLFNEGRIEITQDASFTGEFFNQPFGRIVIDGESTATFADDVLNNGLEFRIGAGSRAVFQAEFSGASRFLGTGEVQFDGLVMLGNSPASVMFDGDVLLGENSLSMIEIAGTEIGDFDQFDITGDLSIDGSLDISLIDGFLLGANMEFLIAEVDGSVVGQFDGLTEGDTAGTFGDHRLTISYLAGDGNDIALRTSAVPEPTTCGFLLCAGLAIMTVRRRR